MSLGHEKYVRLTTFTTDGRPKQVPVWITGLDDGDLGFTTASSSWKVKRIRATPDVVLQPSDSRGRVREGTEPTRGVARVRTGAEFEAVRKQVAKKYGMQFAAISAWGRLARMIGKGSGTDCAIVIEVRD